jgi:F-type H+-transporting ATPase subunit a
MRIFLSAILICLLLPLAFTAHAKEMSDSLQGQHKKLDPGEVIMEHVLDKHYWHFFSITRSDGSEWRAQIDLPVILYSKNKGWNVFSYARFDNGKSGYDGYHIGEKGHIIADDGSKFYDLSLSKVVIQLLFSALLMLWMFNLVAKRYKTPSVAAPKGFQSAVEIVILFVRDEIALPMLGKKANKYLPYLLSVFFFIWINNMLGLIPGSANVTGNIAITTTLALITFTILIFSSKWHYWKHILIPDIPVAMYVIMVPVEIMGIFIKPMALLIRLFANMTAGHLIILTFLMLIFIFAPKGIIAGAGVSIFSVAFSVFIYFLEILVAALQAYIFTMLSAAFIGEAAGEPEHHIEPHKGI